MAIKFLTREATNNDLVDLARLNELFNEVAATPDQLAERLAHPNCAEIPIVVEIDNRVVGFAALRVVPSVFYEEAHAELTEIFVEEPYRRQGAGSAIIRFAERLAHRKGAEEIILQTGRGNQGAQDFYNAMGYKEWAIVMGKTLSPK
jgi:GNAT superfamily N-acetyltransferase